MNEAPEWVLKPDKPMYTENGTGVVATYKAMDPEGSGVTYSLVEGTDDALADYARFDIGNISGRLTFKESPNYEKPEDAGTPSEKHLHDHSASHGYR